MDGQFERIFSLPQNLYTEGSPLILSAGALLLDKQIAKFLVQLKFKNIGQKMPVSVTVKIVEMDSNQAPLGTQTEFVYTNLSASRGENFGMQTPIFIENSDIRTFAVSIQKVVFADASVFTAVDQLLTESLPPPVPLKDWLLYDEAIHEYHARFGKSAACKPEKHHGIWRCCCGAVNFEDEAECYACYHQQADFSEVDPVALKNDNIYVWAGRLSLSNDVSKLQNAIILFSSIRDWKDSESRIDYCKKRIDQLQTAEAVKSKEFTKHIIISIAFILTLLGIIILSIFLSQNKQYNNAIDLMNAEKYADAIEEFHSLGNYKDSEQYIHRCIKEATSYYLDHYPIEKLFEFYDNLTRSNMVEEQYISVPDEYCDKYYDQAVAYYQKDGIDIWDSDFDRNLEALASRLQHLPSTYTKGQQIIEFYNFCKNLTWAKAHEYFSENMSVLKSIFQNEFVKKVLLSDECITYFMVGEWYTSDNKNSIEFYRNTNGNTSVSYNLPHPNVSADYYDIANCVLQFYNDGNKFVANVYKFTFINADTVNVYCYKNSQTYRLTRRK